MPATTPPSIRPNVAGVAPRGPKGGHLNRQSVGRPRGWGKKKMSRKDASTPVAAPLDHGFHPPEGGYGFSILKASRWPSPRSTHTGVSACPPAPGARWWKYAQQGLELRYSKCSDHNHPEHARSGRGSAPAQPPQRSPRNRAGRSPSRPQGSPPKKARKQPRQGPTTGVQF